ncbi:MAG TPA: hypothetical protein VM187_08145 [Niastella sp.]|nr:hypothetical protein [Niastella sp.]
MKKGVVLVFTVLVLATTLQAQDPEEIEVPKRGYQKAKLFMGGNFGLAFGDYTFINISPQLGYRFNDRFAAGFGINGQHVSFKDWDYYNNLYQQKETVLGLNIFGRAYPIRNIMLQAQPEVNYRFGKIIYEGPPKQVTRSDAAIVPSLLLGGGAVFPSGRSELLITIFYDVLQNKNSPYGKRPIFNFGYNFGF